MNYYILSPPARVMTCVRISALPCYITNMETQKPELHFKREDYLALSEDLKKEINSNFLFSRTADAWVSRAKFLNLWRAEAAAKKLGLTDRGKIGETPDFEEQMERKAQRAKRYEFKSRRADQRRKMLQKPIEDMHGDNAFFTQPEGNSSAGRAFANKRKRMIAVWDRGLEEFRKTEYYDQCLYKENHYGNVGQSAGQYYKQIAKLL